MTSQNGEAVLEIKELTKEFGGVQAVNALSFKVFKNEILGIIGPNGAGKTTVINMVSGFSPSTHGNIIFENNNITKLKAHQIASLGIGRNFQSSFLFMDLTVIENVYLAFHLNYKSKIWAQLLRLPSVRQEENELKRKAEVILEEMGLSSIKNEITRNLPHGYQRMLGVCIALATQPKLLLLDEPMTGMNQNEIQIMLSLVKGIREKGITIVMIEHNMSAVLQLCDRLIVLNHGQKIAEGIPQEIISNKFVIEAYLGKE